MKIRNAKKLPKDNELFEKYARDKVHKNEKLIEKF